MIHSYSANDSFDGIFSLIGGKSESNANLAEGLATALVCFDDMNEIREEHRFQVQNHCILLCNSTPYSMPVTECLQYENKTIEQMAALFQEVSIMHQIYVPKILIVNILNLLFKTEKYQFVNHFTTKDSNFN